MSEFMREIPVYRSTVQVGALQIAQIVPHPRGFDLHFVDKRFVPAGVSKEWVQDNCPLPGGYLVIGGGKTYTYMHAEFFEACFAPTDTGVRMVMADKVSDDRTKH